MENLLTSSLLIVLMFGSFGIFWKIIVNKEDGLKQEIINSEFRGKAEVSELAQDLKSIAAVSLADRSMIREALKDKPDYKWVEDHLAPYQRTSEAMIYYNAISESLRSINGQLEILNKYIRNGDHKKN